MSEQYNVEPASTNAGTIAQCFLCPSCSKYMLPPIRLCESGHSICNMCVPNLTCCPRCHLNLITGGIEGRNYSMESVFLLAEFQCQNFGCNETLYGPSVLMHSESCPFRFRRCPFASSFCSWHGNFGSFWNHICNNHAKRTLGSNERATFILRRNVDQAGSMLLTYHNNYFVVILRKDRSEMLRCCVFQLDWQKNYRNGSLFYYKIEIFNRYDEVSSFEREDWCATLYWEETDILGELRSLCLHPIGQVIYDYKMSSKRIEFIVNIMD